MKTIIIEYIFWPAFNEFYLCSSKLLELSAFWKFIQPNLNFEHGSQITELNSIALQTTQLGHLSVYKWSSRTVN